MNILQQMLFSVRLDKIPFSEGLLVAIMGLLIVFVVLVVLVCLLKIFSKVFDLKIFKDKKKEVQTAPMEMGNDENDEETVAAISAAISMILSCESESDVKPTFIIKNLKRLK